MDSVFVASTQFCRLRLVAVWRMKAEAVTGHETTKRPAETEKVSVGVGPLLMNELNRITNKSSPPALVGVALPSVLVPVK